MSQTKGKDSNVKELNKAIAYQEGSVVSRQLIKKKAGNVTVFAFDKGEGLSEHTAPFDVLVFIMEGKVEITLSGKKHILVGGEYIIFPKDAPHKLHGVEKFKMMLTMIKSDD